MKKRFQFAIFDNRINRRVISFKFGRGGFFAGMIILLLLLAVISWCLIVYTPLKQYIPGYPDEQTRRDAVQNALMADSLRQVSLQWELYLLNLQRVISDKMPLSQEEIFTSRQKSAKNNEPTLRSREDSLLRADVLEREKFSVSQGGREVVQIEGLLFFPPVKGIISDSFDALAGHYAIDIAAPDNALVMAVLDGTVTMATWTEETGYVLQIQHENNLISVYKHCADLFNKVGDTVHAGAAVGVVGDSGTFSTGNHLHFELWHKGTPLDPAKYINF